MSTRSVIHRLEGLQRKLADKHIGSLVVYGLAFFTTGLGVAMMSTPEAFLASPTFQAVFLLATPLVWGILFIFSAFVTAVGYWGNRENGRPGALGLTILYTVFATLSSINPFLGNGVLSAAVVYSALAYFSLVALICCTVPKEL